jgi:hypothetical protein
VFLWIRHGGLAPITGIDVVFGDEEPREGFVKLKQSFNSEPVATFCVARVAGKNPITDIKISNGEIREYNILHSRNTWLIPVSVVSSTRV